jgi:hypothetical protein
MKVADMMSRSRHGLQGPPRADGFEEGESGACWVVQRRAKRSAGVAGAAEPVEGMGRILLQPKRAAADDRFFEGLFQL